VNIKYMKFISIVITVTVFIGLSFYFISERSPIRKIAESESENDHLSDGQKLKWSAIEQFSIRKTNESLFVDIPHIIDLCDQNKFLVFKFSAIEIMIAGENPSIELQISCQEALSSAKNQYEILFSDLVSLHELKTKRTSHGLLSSSLIYSDEPLPMKWNLSEISILGTNAFTINRFEILKVFGQNFDFELIK
jgi:hypothetical protein